MPPHPLVTVWLIANKELIATVGALCGIVFGPVLNSLKSILVTLHERSLTRKIDQNAELIGQCIQKMKAAREVAADLPAPLPSATLEPYQAFLQDRLAHALSELQLARQRLQLRDAAQFTQPVGVRRALLLYRPHGKVAWLLHSSFYALISFVLIFCIIFGFTLLKSSENRPYWVYAVVFVALYLVIALFPRGIALRDRRLWIYRKDRPDPNRDLSPTRKFFLAFKAPTRAIKVERVFAYIFFIDAFAGPFINADDHTSGHMAALELMVVVLLMVLLSAALWYDALLRRAVARMETPG